MAVGADLDGFFRDGFQDAFPDFPDDVGVPLPPQIAGNAAVDEPWGEGLANRG